MPDEPNPMQNLIADHRRLFKAGAVPTAETFADAADSILRVARPVPPTYPSIEVQLREHAERQRVERAQLASLTQEQIAAMKALASTLERFIVALEANSDLVAANTKAVEAAWDISDDADAWKEGLDDA